MVDYTFTTDQGWKVTEYRPFSASYAVLHTPCVAGYMNRSHQQPKDRLSKKTSESYTPVDEYDLLGQLTSRQMTFEFYSTDVLRHVAGGASLYTGQHRSAILSRLSDLTGEIDGASLHYTPDREQTETGL